MKALVPAAVLIVTVAAQTPGQDRPTITIRGDAAAVWLRQETAPGLVEQFRGPGLSGEARVNYSQLAFGASLFEGSLDASGGGGSKRDLVEGRVLVAARPLPWLEISAGPFLRAFVTDSTTERWVVWQGRARVDAPIVVNRVTSYVEAWRALSSRVTLPSAPLSAGRVQGGEAGVTYRPPRGPIWLRLAYRVDSALLGGGPGGSETVETVSLSVGLGR